MSVNKLLSISSLKVEKIEVFIKDLDMTTDFNFVDPVYDEIFEREKEKEISRIIFFGKGVELEEVKDKISGTRKNDLNEEYLRFEKGAVIRVDRIISINGIPGPAFDEYNNYGMACLDCN